jgi:hypothetical protein
MNPTNRIQTRRRELPRSAAGAMAVCAAAETRFYPLSGGGRRDLEGTGSAAIKAQMQAAHLELAQIGGSISLTGPEGSMVDLKQRPRMLEYLATAIDAAQKLGTKTLLVLTGNALPDRSLEDQHRSIVEGMKEARKLAGRPVPHADHGRKPDRQSSEVYRIVYSSGRPIRVRNLGLSLSAKSACASPVAEISSAPEFCKMSFARFTHPASSQCTDSRMPPSLTRPS